MEQKALYEAMGSCAAPHTRAHYDFDPFIDRLELRYRQIAGQYQTGRAPLPLAQLMDE